MLMEISATTIPLQLHPLKCSHCVKDVLAYPCFAMYRVFRCWSWSWVTYHHITVVDGVDDFKAVILSGLDKLLYCCPAWTTIYALTT